MLPVRAYAGRVGGTCVRVEPLVSHVVPLAGFERGLRLAEEDPDRMNVQYAMGAKR